MVMITEVRHTGVVVSGMEDALFFYRDLLGLKVTKDFIEESDHINEILSLSGIRLRIVKLSIGKTTILELFHFLKPEMNSVIPPIWNIGCSHIAFTVKNINKVYEELLNHGVHFNCPPCLSPDGSVMYTYCKDPDGTNIELVQVISKS